MVDPLILLLFLISGAATGWLGVDLLPEPLLLQVTNVEGLRMVLAGFGAFFGVIAGFFSLIRVGAVVIALAMGFIILAGRKTTPYRGMIPTYLPLLIAISLFAMAIALPRGL